VKNTIHSIRSVADVFLNYLKMDPIREVCMEVELLVELINQSINQFICHETRTVHVTSMLLHWQEQPTRLKSANYGSPVQYGQPVSVAQAERSISVVRRLKTWLR